MACPMCDHDQTCHSWLGSAFFNGKEFHYAQCLFCGSHYCDPMPDNETLSRMYSHEYLMNASADPAIADPKEPHRVIEWLKKAKAGTFIDYGCGSGNLLIDAMALNWQAVGVEFDEEVAKAVEGRIHARVINRYQVELLDRNRADVLHLGDVIEHLTDVNRQIPEILRLIKPGGLLIAQGPLEGNVNLFYVVLRLVRLLRRSHHTGIPPYHVILTSVKGQKEFFCRFKLEELEFSVREVSWPAPSKLSLSDFRRPRTVGLFLLRRISQMASTLRPSLWGNRYLYVGRWNG